MRALDLVPTCKATERATMCLVPLLIPPLTRQVMLESLNQALPAQDDAAKRALLLYAHAPRPLPATVTIWPPVVATLPAFHEDTCGTSCDIARESVPMDNIDICRGRAPEIPAAKLAKT